MTIKTVGSICSGIESATVAWNTLLLSFKWFSEIAVFQSALLKEKYPNIINVGDMNNIPNLLKRQDIETTDLLCAGTPCQAFSFAGHRKGISDDRGNLTLKLLDILDTNDKIRKEKGLKPSVLLWENVIGVLTDKTNAFGCFISALAGLKEVLNLQKYPHAGYIKGTKRNVAWRVLDAKYFGLPQQRKRLYLLAGDTTFHPENILFELHTNELKEFPTYPLTFTKNDTNFEIFREYTDCLYASYGTKWNGNAAANNGSLFISQDNKLRRLSPLECERLMGFPDNYTNLPFATITKRYQSLGNAWAIPVITWIGKRLLENTTTESIFNKLDIPKNTLISFSKNIYKNKNITLNCSPCPENPVFNSMQEIVDVCTNNHLFLSKQACEGILKRAIKNKSNINTRLKEILETSIK